MTPKKRIFVILCLLIGTAFASQGHAFKLESDGYGHTLHWPASAFPVPYKITDAPPVPKEAFIQAVQQSFNTWQGVNNATITFVYTGSTEAKRPAYDGKNTVIMGRNITGGDIVGQTYIYYSIDDGRILDADIILNASYPWSTEGAANALDVQNAATHEIGHLCGLDDLYSDEDSEKTMYGYIDLGETKKRSLDPDDMAGLATIYPIGSSDDDSGGGGGGCGTLSPTSSPPGQNGINFLWVFLLLAFLWARRFLPRTSGR